MAVLGTVVSVNGLAALVGKVLVIKANGDKVPLKLNDTVEPGDTIVTPKGVIVELELANGKTIQIFAEQTVQLTPELADAVPPSSGDSAIDSAAIQTVIQAIEEGRDIGDVLDDAAAGLGSSTGRNEGVDEAYNVPRYLELLDTLGASYDFARAEEPTIEPLFFNEQDDFLGFGNNSNDTVPPVLPSAFLAPTSDSGVPGDNITNDTTPEIRGPGTPGDIVRGTFGGVAFGPIIIPTSGEWSFTPATGFPDGPVTVTVEIEDPEGSVTPGNPITIIVDTTPPAVDLDDIALTNDNTPALTGTVDDPTAAVVVTISGVDYPAVNNGDGTWTLADDAVAALADGTTTATVTATDVAGNAGTGTGDITVDATAPAAPTVALTTDSGTGGDLITNDGSLTVTPNEVGNTIEYSTDGGTNWTTTPPTATEGSNTVTVREIDPAGNPSAPAAITFTLDTTPPAVDLDDIALTNDNTPALTGTVDDPTAAVVVTISGVDYPAVNNGDGTWTLADDAVAALADGTTTATVTATDVAGNAGTGTGDITVDATAPAAPTVALTTDSGTGGDLITNDGSLTVTPNEVGNTIEYSTDGGTNWTTTPPTATEGSNTVTVREIDPAGNPSAPAAITFTLDTTPPAVDMDDIALTNDNTPALTGTVDDPTAAVVVTISGVDYPAVNNGDGTWTLADDAVAALADGTTTATVTATDVAGNAGTGTGDITVDATAPAAPTVALTTDSGTGGDLITNDGSLTVTPNEVGNTIEYSTDGGTNWTTTPPTATEGSNTVTVREIDPAGNPSAPAAITFTLDTTPPAVDMDDIALTNDNTPALTGTVDDPTAAVVVTISGVDYPAVNNGDGTWTLADDAVAALADGTTTATVTATDVAGNAGTGTGDITVDATAPAAPTVALTTDSGTGGDLITNDGSLTVTPNEVGNTIEYSTDGGTNWTTTPPTATEGSNTVTVREIDPAGNPSAPAAITFTLDTTPPAVDMDDIALTNDNTPALTGTVDDPTAAVVVTISGVDYPAVNNGDGTWTLADDAVAALADGTTTATVTATDVAGNAGTGTGDITVDATAPAAPTVALTTDSGTGGDLITNDGSLTVTPNEVGNTIEYSTDGGTNWTTTPPTATEGSNTVTVREIDPAGNPSAPAAITFTLDTTPPAVDLDDIALTNDNTPALTGTVDDPTAAVVVTISGVDYPAVNNGDGTWTLADDAVAALADGTTTATVTATDVAGNAGTGTGDITVDATAPAAPTVALTTDSGTGGDLITNDGSLTVTPNEVGNTIEYSTDGGTNWTTTPPTATEGSNTVTVREIDPAGNPSAPAAITFTLDTTPPAVDMDDIALTNDNTPALTGTVDDPTAAVVVTISGVDYPAVNNGDGTWTLADDAVAALADGTTTATVTATDVAGNAGTGTGDITVNTGVPTITIGTIAGDDIVNAVEDNTAVSISGTTSGVEDGRTVSVTINGQTYVGGVSGNVWTVTMPAAEAQLLDATEVVTADVSNAAGTAAAQATSTVTYDATAPVVDMDDIALTNDNTPALTGTVDDPTAAVVVTISGVDYPAVNNGDGTWTLADDVIATLPNGSTTVTVTATDVAGNIGSGSGTVTYDDLPVAVVDAAGATDEDTAVVITAASLLANDTNLGDGPVTVTSVQAAVNGTVALSGTDITFTPDADYNGPASFTYTITDADGDTSTATVNLTVNSVDDLPVAVVDAAGATDEDTAVVITAASLLANDTNLGDGPVTVTSVQAAVNGTVALSGTNITFTPDADYNGPASFTYTITDADGDTSTATVNLTVNSVDDLPVAVVDAAGATDEDTAVVITAASLLANDTNLGDGPVTVTSVQAAVNGTVALSGTDITFTPDADYNGPASFTYTITDADGDTSTATVNLTVNAINDAPVAVDDAITVNEDVVFGSVTDLDENDTDVDSGSLTVVPGTFATAQGGSIVIEADGSYTYTPPTNYNGPDSVDYTVTDGSLTDIGTLNFTVNPVNDAPVNTLPASYTTDEDTSVQLTGLSIADVDAGTGVMTVTLTVSDGSITGNSVGGVSVFNASATTIELTGTLANLNAYLSTNAPTFTPMADFNGTATLTMTTDDQGNAGGPALTDADTINIQVAPVNDAPVLSDAGDTVYFRPYVGAAIIDNTLTIADVDDTNIESATVTITGNFATAEDVLVFTNANGITGNYDAATGVLTLTGSASKADYEAALESITYDNTSSTPTEGVRTISWSINDGNVDSNTVTSDVVVGDNDGDGVFDSVDVDDDNDGILDTEEFSAVLRSQTVTILGGDPASGYTFGGSFFGNLNDKMNNDANFGDGGIVTEGSVNVVGTATTIDAAYLAQGTLLFDGFTGPSNYTAAELTAIDAWVQAGGILFSTNDNNTVDPISTYYGLEAGPNRNVSNTWEIQDVSDPRVASLVDGSIGLGVNLIGKTITANDLYSGFEGALAADDIVLAKDTLTGLPTVVVRPLGDGYIIFTGDEGIFREVTAGNTFDANDNEDAFAAALIAWGIENASTRDSDGDGADNSLDIDSDNDGITDNIEAQVTGGYIAPSGSGTGITDINNDGLDDNYDDRTVTAATTAATVGAGNGAGLTTVDTDGDRIADFIDLDSDSDGTDDIAERGDGAPTSITSTTDSDSDGLLDIFEGVDANDGFDVNDENLTNLSQTAGQYDFRYVPIFDGDVLFTDDFNGPDGSGDDMEGWVQTSIENAGQGAVTNDNGTRLRFEGDSSAEKTFDFGVENAGQEVTITFDSISASGFDNGSDQYTIQANGVGVAGFNPSTTLGTGNTFTATVQPDGTISLTIIANPNFGSEDLAIDNLVVTANGNNWVGTTQLISAQFVDGIVEGLYYETSSGLTGYTDADGNFDYLPDDVVTFKIGGVAVGLIDMTTIEDGKVFLQDIADVDRTDVNDEYLENMAVLLQSLDADSSDNILITQAMHDALSGEDFDLASISEEALAEILAGIGVDVVSEDAAMDHVQEMLEAYTDLEANDFDARTSDNDPETAETLTVSAGVETFKWAFNDQGEPGAPAIDVIADFDPSAAGGDVLDLRDLLTGEQHVTGVGNLESFLHFELVGSDTVIHVSDNGGFSNGYTPTGESQTITLTNVDLVSALGDDQAIIQDLLASNKLIVD